MSFNLSTDLIKMAAKLLRKIICLLKDISFENWMKYFKTMGILFFYTKEEKRRNYLITSKKFFFHFFISPLEYYFWNHERF